jgi:hypothetical protein
MPKIPEILNEAGRRMVTGIVRDMSQEEKIPMGAIRNALIVRSATTLEPNFSVGSSQDMFPYVTWRTAGDEKVCKICGPREGINYRLEEIEDRFPAHIHCRCRLDPVPVGDIMTEKAQLAMPDALRYAGELIQSTLRQL